MFSCFVPSDRLRCFLFRCCFCDAEHQTSVRHLTCSGNHSNDQDQIGKCIIAALEQDRTCLTWFNGVQIGGLMEEEQRHSMVHVPPNNSGGGGNGGGGGGNGGSSTTLPPTFPLSLPTSPNLPSPRLLPPLTLAPKGKATRTVLLWLYCCGWFDGLFGLLVCWWLIFFFLRCRETLGGRCGGAIDLVFDCQTPPQLRLSAIDAPIDRSSGVHLFVQSRRIETQPFGFM